MRYELFSKRQKRLRGEVPDVYQYETIPEELRVQIICIWQAVLRQSFYGSYRGIICDHSYLAYKAIHDILSYRYGKFTLNQDNNFDYDAKGDDFHYNTVIEFFLRIDNTEHVIDVIEVSFRYIDQVIRDNRDANFAPNISPDDAIDELNYQFRDHGVGYQYESGQIIKVDSRFTHAEVVKPALSFLSDSIYEGANEEFLKAHEHYQKGRYKECLNDCLKAFESCLKAICQKRGWNFNKKDTANRLIAIVFDNGLIQPLMQSHFSALRSTLESGVPTIRNDQAGHGQGSEKVIVPEYIAAYALHLTASNILLLANADEEMK